MSRESILSAVKKNKPELLPLPEIDLSVFDELKAQSKSIGEAFKGNNYPYDEDYYLNKTELNLIENASLLF